MKIAVDGFPLWMRTTGIGTYTRELLRALVAAGGDDCYHLADMGPRIGNAPLPRHADGAAWDAHLDGLAGRVPAYWKAIPYLFRKVLLRRIAARFAPDVFLGTCYFGLFHPSFKTVITIYDMNHVRHPETAHPSIYRSLVRHLPRHARRAHAIFAISEATRRDVVSFLGVPVEKVHVVGCGVAESFRPICDPQKLAGVRGRYGLPPRFVLYVGTLEPRKNLVRLIDAFDLMSRDTACDVGLVLVGAKGWRDEAIVQALERCAARDRVLMTGYVAKEDVPALYSLADVFAFPSLCEGFGLPVAEAMACGAPVVTSQVSSLPEVVGDAGLLVDPLSTEAIAAALRRVLADPDLAAAMRQRGLVRARQFTWKSAARQAERVFRQVCQPQRFADSPPQSGLRSAR